jgi:DNA-binding transcriptional LysR family regulator
MPRLADFLAKNPQITINTVSKLSQFDFSKEDVHCAIHFGQADWSQANCTFLMAEESVPVCSPTLFEKEGLAHTSNVCASLINLPLLHISTRPDAWQQWFNKHKSSSKTQMIEKAHQGMHFEQFSIATNAAIAGLGVALLPRFLIESELQRGELQVICNKPQHTDNGYYLVTPNDKIDYAPIRVFTRWITRVIAFENEQFRQIN